MNEHINGKTEIICAVSLENLSLWVSPRSCTNQAILPQKRARDLKFLIHEVEELYYLCFVCLFDLMLYVPVNSHGHVGTSPPILWDF